MVSRFGLLKHPPVLVLKHYHFRKITALRCHLKFPNDKVSEVRNIYETVGVMQFIGEK